LLATDAPFANIITAGQIIYWFSFYVVLPIGLLQSVGHQEVHLVCKNRTPTIAKVF